MTVTLATSSRCVTHLVVYFPCFSFVHAAQKSPGFIWYTNCFAAVLLMFGLFVVCVVCLCCLSVCCLCLLSVSVCLLSVSVCCLCCLFVVCVCFSHRARCCSARHPKYLSQPLASFLVDGVRLSCPHTAVCCKANTYLVVMPRSHIARCAKTQLCLKVSWRDCSDHLSKVSGLG